MQQKQQQQDTNTDNDVESSNVPLLPEEEIVHYSTKKKKTLSNCFLRALTVTLLVRSVTTPLWRARFMMGRPGYDVDISRQSIFSLCRSRVQLHIDGLKGVLRHEGLIGLWRDNLFSSFWILAPPLALSDYFFHAYLSFWQKAKTGEEEEAKALLPPRFSREDMCSLPLSQCLAVTGFAALLCRLIDYLSLNRRRRSMRLGASLSGVASYSAKQFGWRKGLYNGFGLSAVHTVVLRGTQFGGTFYGLQHQQQHNQHAGGLSRLRNVVRCFFSAFAACLVGSVLAHPIAVLLSHRHLGIPTTVGSTKTVSQALLAAWLRSHREWCGSLSERLRD